MLKYLGLIKKVFNRESVQVVIVLLDMGLNSGALGGFIYLFYDYMLTK